VFVEIVGRMDFDLTGSLGNLKTTKIVTNAISYKLKSELN